MTLEEGWSAVRSVLTEVARITLDPPQGFEAGTAVGPRL
jgi:hypothetical protein